MVKALFGCGPLKLGVKLTVKVHIELTAREGGQSFVCAKSVLMDFPEIIRGAVPMFFNVTD
jgi:hypothetical protein